MNMIHGMYNIRNNGTVTVNLSVPTAQYVPLQWPHSLQQLLRFLTLWPWKWTFK